MIRRPMKGEQVDDFSKLNFPVIGFPKIDGFRCILQDKPLTSRLSPFPNRHFMKEASGLLQGRMMLDGEVVVGSRKEQGVLQRTSSGLTSVEGKPDWNLWVFDALIGEEMKLDPFLARYEAANTLVEKLDHPRIHLLKYELLKNLDDFEEYLARRLKFGYEGVMVRSVSGPYKEGKSTINQGWLLKIKPFTDFEARIIGYFEEMQNTNEAQREVTGKLKRSSAKSGKVAKGRLGGFIGLDLKTGEEVRVGGGFTHDQRVHFWAIKEQLVKSGAIMTCSKQQTGEKDKPRHPNFVRLRPKWDL